MISRIRGTLLRREIGVVEIMTPGGVAYEVQIPLMVYERLPKQGGEIELLTWQVVREDDVALYGFLEDSERAVFARLLTASGIGPHLALRVLSALPPDRIVRAILDKDIAALRRIPGLGAKKAERLTLELADRLGDLTGIGVSERGRDRASEEAVGALVALGYTPAEATAAVRDVLDDRSALTGIGLIKAALAVLGGSR
jgi:Holliday junction DNA helicase RuvA